jgi:ATP-dependent Zn protease
MIANGWNTSLRSLRGAHERRQVRRLVRKHRDEIERVAKALLHRKSLTPDEVDQLIYAGSDD